MWLKGIGPPDGHVTLELILPLLGRGVLIVTAAVVVWIVLAKAISVLLDWD